MPKFKILKKFVSNELIDNPKKGDPGQPEKIRKEYNPGQPILLNNDMEISRMMSYGIIAFKKKRGRKPKLERAVIV